VSRLEEAGRELRDTSVAGDPAGEQKGDDSR